MNSPQPPIDSTGRELMPPEYIEAVLDDTIQVLEGCANLETRVHRAPAVDETGCNWIADYEQPKRAPPDVCVLVIELIGNAKRHFNLPALTGG